MKPDPYTAITFTLTVKPCHKDFLAEIEPSGISLHATTKSGAVEIALTVLRSQIEHAGFDKWLDIQLSKRPSLNK